MEEDEISFQLRVMPPPPRGSSAPSALTDTEKPSRTFRLAFKPSDTFGVAWGKIQKHYDLYYPQAEREAAWFTKIQDVIGSDFGRNEKVGTHYNSRMPMRDLVLVMRQAAIDDKSSLAPGTHLQPAGYKRRHVEDLTPDRQEAFKRRRLEEGRYGSALSDLDADTPVTSRENVNVQGGAAVDEQQGEEGAQDEGRVFKKPQIPDGIRGAQATRNAQVAEDSQGTVLIQDSQPQPGSERSRGATLDLRERSNGPRALQNLAQDHSSPAEAVAARNGVTAHSRIPNVRQGTIPTPDSNVQGFSSDRGAPTSAQRAQVPHSETSRRFIRRQAPPALFSEQDIAVEDPIQDDLYDDIIDVNGDDDVLERPRGRTRSRSLESNLQNHLPSDRGNRSSSRALPSVGNGNLTTDDHPLPGDSHRLVTSETVVAENPSSSNPFGQMMSSQTARASSVHTNHSNARRWSPEEDKAILRGVRKGWGPSQILKAYGFDRSDSGVRNRKAHLLKTYPGGIVPPGDKYYEPGDTRAESSNGTSASRPSASQPWTQTERTKLRTAISDGYDIREVRSTFNRSEEALGKMWREHEPAVLKLMKEKDDFPRSDIEDERWKPRHDLKLRRFFLKQEMHKLDEGAAYRVWFSSLPMDLFKKKLAEYKTQLSNLGRENDLITGPVNGPTPQSQLDDLNDQFEEQSAGHPAAEVNSEAVEPPEEQEISQSSALPDMNSSPPDVPDEAQRTSPHVLVSTQEQRTAIDGQDTSIKPSENEIAEQPTTTSTQRGSGNGTGRQGTIGQYYPTISRSRPDQPTRPSTSELDAQVGRVSPLAPANGEQLPAGLQAREDSSLAGGDDDDDAAGNKSESEGELDIDRIEREISPDSTVQHLIDSQLLMDTEPEPVTQSEVEIVSQPVPEPQSQVEIVSQDQHEHHLETHAEPVTQLDPNSPHPPESQLENLEETQNVIKPGQLPPVEESDRSIQAKTGAGPRTTGPPRRGQPGRLPPRDSSTRRLRERTARNLAAMRAQIDSDVQAQAQAQAQSHHQRQELQRNTSPPQAPKPVSTQMLRDGASAESTTQSQSQSKTGSQSQPNVVVTPWIPFEHRPVGKDGMIDAGRPGFPCRIEPNHPYVESDDVIWAKALEIAEPEWINEVYQDLRDNNLKLICLTARDSEGVKDILRKIRLRRAERRQKMGLPRLQDMRRPRYWVPGMEEVPEPILDTDSQYEPDDEDEDPRESEIMLKTLPHGDSDLAVDEDQYPNGVDHDRHFSEVGDEEDEVEARKILDLDLSVLDRTDQHEEDADLPTSPPPASVEDISGPTDAELQDLVQSGDVDVYDATKNFVETRQQLSRSRSPEVQPSREPSRHVAEPLQIVASLDGTNERALDQDIAPRSHRRQTQTNRPARGVRSTNRNLSNVADGETLPSVERSATQRNTSTANVRGQTPLRDSSTQSPAVEMSQSEDLPSKPKTRKTAREMSSEAGAETLLEQVEPEQQADEEIRKRGSRNTKYLEDDDEEFVQPRSRKKRSKISASENKVADSRTKENAAEQKVQTTHTAMPPPSFLPEDLRTPHMDRQDSFSSSVTESSNVVRYGMRNDGAVRSKRSARRHRDKQRRESGETTSFNGLAAGNTVEVSTSPPPKKASEEPSSLTAASETQEVHSPHPAPHFTAVNNPVRQAAAQPLTQNGAVASTRQISSGTATTTTGPRQETGSRLQRLRQVTPNFPAAPQRREPTPPPKLPYASDDDESSSHGSAV